jgi:hypothetical protein
VATTIHEGSVVSFTLSESGMNFSGETACVPEQADV